MKLQDRGEQIPMFITKLGHNPIVFGIPWLLLQDVVVPFVSYTVTFGSQYCITRCYYALVPVQRVTEEPLEPVY
jgi:hypothetical protein